MTTQYDFTNDDWKLVATTPLLVGMAIAHAEDSGFFGSIRESKTLVAELQNEPTQNPASSLIAQAGAYDHEDEFETYKSMSAEALAADAAAACSELSVILDRVAEPAEATGYKQWILGLAKNVANAAREDGVRVSPGESLVLETVRSALKISHRS